jgi:hypothetical protein
MFPAPDDQRHDSIAVATSFAYERFDLATRFTRVHSM